MTTKKENNTFVETIGELKITFGIVFVFWLFLNLLILAIGYFLWRFK